MDGEEVAEDEADVVGEELAALAGPLLPPLVATATPTPIPTTATAATTAVILLRFLAAACCWAKRAWTRSYRARSSSR